MLYIKKTQPFMIFFFLFLFLISKSAMSKKIRFVSKEDTNQFLILKKCRLASNEDANQHLMIRF